MLDKNALVEAFRTLAAHPAAFRHLSSSVIRLTDKLFSCPQSGPSYNAQHARNTHDKILEIEIIHLLFWSKSDAFENEEGSAESWSDLGSAKKWDCCLNCKQ